MRENQCLEIIFVQNTSHELGEQVLYELNVMDWYDFVKLRGIKIKFQAQKMVYKVIMVKLHGALTQ